MIANVLLAALEFFAVFHLPRYRADRQLLAAASGSVFAWLDKTMSRIAGFVAPALSVRRQA